MSFFTDVNFFDFSDRLTYKLHLYEITYPLTWPHRELKPYLVYCSCIARSPRPTIYPLVIYAHVEFFDEADKSDLDLNLGKSLL